MKNLRKKFMNANALKLVLSMGAAVFALTLSSYRNRLVPVTYSNVNQSTNPTSITASDYRYRPAGECATTSTKHCSFTVMEATLPAVNSSPTQAQVNDAVANNQISKANYLE